MSNNLEENIDKEHELELLRLAQNHASATRKSLLARVFTPSNTTTYQPTNVQWEVTFKALGWNRDTIEQFWQIFTRMNQSKSGEITPLEFYTFFDMEDKASLDYIEKCFSYFDSTGSSDGIDFLEFIISVWNICTLKISTLTNFTFDIYDLDSDGELSLPEIERMIQELYGPGSKNPNSKGHFILNDINHFAEIRGGVLDLTAFTMYTRNHSMLLFPVFRIQRWIQEKIMGLKYWENVERTRGFRSDELEEKDGMSTSFDPRHVQILLRTYKTGEAAAVLTHTGDPNIALRQYYENRTKDEEESVDVDSSTNELEETEESNKGTLGSTSRLSNGWENVKSKMFEKIQASKNMKLAAEKEIEKKIKSASEIVMSVGKKTNAYISSKKMKRGAQVTPFKEAKKEVDESKDEHTVEEDIEAKPASSLAEEEAKAETENTNGSIYEKLSTYQNQRRTPSQSKNTQRKGIQMRAGDVNGRPMPSYTRRRHRPKTQEFNIRDQSQLKPRTPGMLVNTNDI